MEIWSSMSICVGDFSAMSLFLFLFVLELQAFGRLLNDDLVPHIVFIIVIFSTNPLPVFGVRSCVFHSFFPVPNLFCLIVLSGSLEKALSGLLFSYQGIHALFVLPYSVSLWISSLGLLILI